MQYHDTYIHKWYTNFSSQFYDNYQILNKNELKEYIIEIKNKLNILKKMYNF